jgi:fumarate hydratase subunit alpha
MRKINARDITSAVAKLCIEANTNLRPDVYRALIKSLASEKNRRARGILQSLLENAACARKLKVAICQDTGLAYVFARLGQAVCICGGGFLKALTRGIEQGYRKGCLRSSVVAHPLKRDARPGFSPGVVHIDIVKGRHISLTVLPKGFGCENKSAVKMFKPTEEIGRIKDFIVGQVKQAGPSACPPFVVGVGIGGGLDTAALLAKKALLQPLDRKNPDRLLARLEKELLYKINRLGIGPLGLGGRTSCLGVNVLSYPTHIAGLPVAVNISCHALRSASRRL